MGSVLAVLVVLVALEHLWFLVLEMLLWTRPIGLRTFRNTPETARQSAALAANQGLYNGFLAAGLLWGAFHPLPEVALSSCTAGCRGWRSTPSSGGPGRTGGRS